MPNCNACFPQTLDSFTLTFRLWCGKPKRGKCHIALARAHCFCHAVACCRMPRLTCTALPTRLLYMHVQEACCVAQHKDALLHNGWRRGLAVLAERSIALTISYGCVCLTRTQATALSDGPLSRKIRSAYSSTPSSPRLCAPYSCSGAGVNNQIYLYLRVLILLLGLVCSCVSAFTRIFEKSLQGPC